ncbi:UNVERIFIED_CONTAM: hypothetical protein K2H54_069086 [Gekko kuhli]
MGPGRLRALMVGRSGYCCLSLYRPRHHWVAATLPRSSQGRPGNAAWKRGPRSRIRRRREGGERSRGLFGSVCTRSVECLHEESGEVQPVESSVAVRTLPATAAQISGDRDKNDESRWDPLLYGPLCFVSQFGVVLS